MNYKLWDNAKKKLYNNLQQMIEQKLFNDKFIVIFGTSKISSMIMCYLKENSININSIIDNDSSRHGCMIMNVEVNSPEKILRDFKDEAIILVASSYQNNMIDQLEQMGYSIGRHIIKVIDLPSIMESYDYIDRSQYKEMNIDEIKCRQLNLLKYFKEICDKNNIQYYLGYGTLLGSIRHSGYIPWDDDIDVIIKGEDMKKLVEIMNGDANYSFITCYNCDKYFDQMGIFVDNNSILDINCFPLQATSGISIDVFPLFGIPDKEEELQLYISKLKELEMKKWGNLYSDEKCHKSTLELMNYISSFKFEDYDRVGYLLSPYFTKDIFNKELYLETIQCKFEDEFYSIPIGYKEILKTLYGDYMKLPEENARGKRHYFKAYYPLDDIKHNIENKNYWNKFYNNDNLTNEPSLFACEIGKYIKSGKKLVELGCGNGRDSIYFNSLGLQVDAVDISDRTIDKLKNKHLNNKNINFICDDFIEYIRNTNIYSDYIYSRFTLHSITDDQQSTLLENVYTNLKEKGKFFIEVRSILDDIYGLGVEVGRNAFIYEKHYRRFIVKKELEKELVTIGFKIISSEEKNGFAPFGDKDPIILRIIAEK